LLAAVVAASDAACLPRRSISQYYCVGTLQLTALHGRPLYAAVRSDVYVLHVAGSATLDKWVNHGTWYAFCIKMFMDGTTGNFWGPVDENLTPNPTD
jgi:hypothetical protein